MSNAEADAPRAVIVVSSHVVRGSVGNRAAVFALETLGFPVWAVPTVILPWHPGHSRATRIVPPSDAFAALMEGRTILDLAEGLQLRRVRVMGTNRIELSGFTDTMRQRLTAYGLFHEIISWKLRMFVPVDAAGPAILAKVLDRWPALRIGEREAA